MSSDERRWIEDVRTAARELARRSPLLEQEYNWRHRHDWWRRLLRRATLPFGLACLLFGSLVLLVSPFWLGLFVSVRLRELKSVEWPITLDQLRDSATIFANAAVFLLALLPLTNYQSGVRAVDAFLPVNVPPRHAARYYFLVAIPTLLFLSPAWLACAWATQLTGWQWAATALLLCLQALWIPVLMTLGAGLPLVHRLAHPMVFFPLLGAGVLLLFVDALPPAIATALLLALPTGWVAAVAEFGVLHREGSALLMLLPIAWATYVALRWQLRGQTVQDVYVRNGASMAYYSYSFGMVAPGQSHVAATYIEASARWVGSRSAATQQEVPVSLVSGAAASLPFWKRPDTVLRRLFTAAELDILRLGRRSAPSLTQLVAIYGTAWLVVLLGLAVYQKFSTSAPTRGLFPLAHLSVFVSLVGTVYGLASFRNPAEQQSALRVWGYLPIGLRQWSGIYGRWVLLTIGTLLLMTMLCSAAAELLLGIPWWPVFEGGARGIYLYGLGTPLLACDAIAIRDRTQPFSKLSLKRICLLTIAMTSAMPIALLPTALIRAAWAVLPSLGMGLLATLVLGAVLYPVITVGTWLYVSRAYRHMTIDISY